MVHRIALLGVGPMASFHAKALAELADVKVVSVASRDPAKARAFADQHGIAAARTTDDMLADPQADALWVVAPCDVMAPLAERAAATGLPLFLEKPVGLSAAETDAVASCLTVPTMVGLNRRYYEVIQAARDVVRKAGGLRAIEIHMPEDLTRVPPGKHADRTLAQWQFANSVHLLDLFRFFGGEVVEVQTMNAVPGVLDRSYNALLRLESGAIGHYNAQWYAPGGWRVALYADDVMVELKPVEKATLFRRGAEVQVLEPSGADARLKAGLYGQARAFAALLSGRPDPDAADIAEYARSVRLVERLTRS